MKSTLVFLAIVVVWVTAVAEARKGHPTHHVNAREHEEKVLALRCSTSAQVQNKLKRCEKKMPDQLREFEIEVRTAVASEMTPSEYKEVLCEPDSPLKTKVLEYKEKKWEEIKEDMKLLSKKDKKKLKKYHKCLAKIPM